MVDALERISTKNRNLILQGEFEGNRKVMLIALQNLVMQLGDKQMDLALRMVVETAVHAYINGNFDALHSMGVSIFSQGREAGNA